MPAHIQENVPVRRWLLLMSIYDNISDFCKHFSTSYKGNLSVCSRKTLTDTGQTVIG